MNLTERSLLKNSLHMNWRNWRNWRLGLLCLLLVSCAAKPDTKKERTFKLGLIPGAQEFMDFVMEGHGLLDQVGLKADKVKSLSPANLHLTLAEPKVDIGFG